MRVSVWGFGASGAADSEIWVGGLTHPTKAVDEIANGGLSCEALKIGDNWIQGKLKVMIVLETEEVSNVPQNNDSPLDDIRNLA